MITPIVKRCAILDVHKTVIAATALLKQDNGSIPENGMKTGNGSHWKSKRMIMYFLAKYVGNEIKIDGVEYLMVMAMS